MNSAVAPREENFSPSFGTPNLWAQASADAFDIGTAGSTRLVKSEAAYFLEPEDIQKCVDSALSGQFHCLVLLNKNP